MRCLNSSKDVLSHWKTLLFVPANEQKFINSCASKGASAVVLDLEDSVHVAHKDKSRRAYQGNVTALVQAGVNVAVRINSDDDYYALDLHSVVIEGTQCIVLPKVESSEQLMLIDDLIAELETDRGLVPGSIALIAMVESAKALLSAATWKGQCDRLAGLFFGTEDFCADCEMEPTPDNLYHPAQQVVFAAKSQKLLAFGFPASIANYSNIEELECSIRKGRSIGFNGVFCIHPSQVKVANEIYQPLQSEIDAAREVVTAFESAHENAKGVLQVNGRMVDLPVYQRAKSLVSSLP